MKNQHALFERNPYWYGPKPHILGFGLQFFANPDAMISTFKTGGLDFIGEYTPPTAVATLRQAGFVVSTGPSISMKTFIINTNPQKTTNRELLNPLVREALEYAINREQIVQTAWLGFAQAGSTIIAPADGTWHDPNVHPLPFDIAKANQLLDQAGYPKGPDGIRVANGHKMEYDVIFPPDESGPGDRAFQIIEDGLRQIGIEIRQRNMDDDATFTAISAPDNKYQTFDFAMWDWVPPVDPDFMLSVLTSAQYGNNSDSGYSNPAYDRMYAEQSTLTDPKQRQQLVWNMQEMIYNARPYIILNYPDVIEAHSKNWTGFVMSPSMGSLTSLFDADAAERSPGGLSASRTHPRRPEICARPSASTAPAALIRLACSRRRWWPSCTRPSDPWSPRPSRGRAADRPRCTQAPPAGNEGGTGTPTGICTALGVSPFRMLGTCRSAGSRLGTTDSSAWVYGCCGSRTTSRAEPSSITRPRYMTAMRSAKCAAVERS